MEEPITVISDDDEPGPGLASAFQGGAEPEGGGAAAGEEASSFIEPRRSGRTTRRSTQSTSQKYKVSKRTCHYCIRCGSFLLSARFVVRILCCLPSVWVRVGSACAVSWRLCGCNGSPVSLARAHSASTRPDGALWHLLPFRPLSEYIRNNVLSRKLELELFEKYLL